MPSPGGRIALLGPQRFEPVVGRVADELGMRGAIATVNAGWQEREPDDAELDGLLGGRTRNLHLHGRWLDIAERDPEFAEADTRRRETVAELQSVYLLRLEHAMRSLVELGARTVDREVLAAATQDAIDAVARLDAWHLARVAEVDAAFDERWPAQERDAVAHHRREVADLLESVDGVAIAGGHVGALLHGLRLLDVMSHLGERPVVAWSAGAMALTETVVLFHDHAVHASRHAEVLDRGLGLVRGVVVLPHASRRLDLDDLGRMGRMARRFAPTRCLLLDDGAKVLADANAEVPEAGAVLAEDGSVVGRAA
jgi:hypothetical protein